MTSTACDPRIYFPARLIELEEQWYLEWLVTDELELADPFFEDTLRRVRCKFAENRRRHYKCLSTLDFLTDFYRKPAAPAAIIHHISRCGSTLLTQLFSQLDAYRCFAEVPLFDQLLERRGEKWLTEPTRLFSAALASLCPTKSSTILKTDSWHLFHADFYQECFPDTPTVLLYRNPIEVWQSHSRQPGSHVIPGLLSDAQLNHALSPEERTMPSRSYFAAVMSKYLKRMLEIHESRPGCLLVNYNEGVENMMTRVAHHIGARLSEEDFRAITHRARFNSKNPQLVFLEQPGIEEDLDFLDECLRLYYRLDSSSSSSDNH